MVVVFVAVIRLGFFGGMVYGVVGEEGRPVVDAVVGYETANCETGLGSWEMAIVVGVLEVVGFGQG